MTTDFDLSCGLPPSPDFADLAALAEELGYRRVWIFGSASLWEDPFIHLALAAARTSRMGLATAVLIPGERAPMAEASAIATIARLSGGRFRAGYGTGYTARITMGQPPLTLDALFAHVSAVRGLLAGDTVTLEGKSSRMLAWPGLAASRPVDVPVWLSVFGPRGNSRAPQIADGTIGPVHPTLPSTTMASGTVLEPGETPGSSRVLDAVGPWRAVGWHAAYAHGGAVAVDAVAGGREWRTELEALAPEGRRHLHTFDGHVTHLHPRDRHVLQAAPASGPMDNEIIGDPHHVRERLDQLAAAGFQEVMYTPSGPDVARELRAFASAGLNVIGKHPGSR